MIISLILINDHDYHGTVYRISSFKSSVSAIFSVHGVNTNQQQNRLNLSAYSSNMGYCFFE